MTHRTGAEDLAHLLRAAVAWWESRRPIDWSTERHLGEPSVNRIGPAEKALAEAVARIAARGGRDGG